MKKILVINPIGTDIWDLSDKEYLSDNAHNSTVVSVTSLKKGPTSLETYYDEAMAAPGVLEIIHKNKDDYDAFIVNCFADPGIMGAREIANVPVVGPGQASMTVASMLGHKFGVISIRKKAESMFDQKVASLGLEDKFAGAVGINIGVNELLTDRDATRREILKAANKLIEEKHAEVIVLGCTGMLSFAEDIRKELRVPVVEPTITALKIAEALIDLKLTHSKTALYSNLEDCRQ